MTCVLPAISILNHADSQLPSPLSRCTILEVMGEARKYIITCGLGAFAANDPNAQAHFGPNAGQKAQELLAISTEKANKAGFELVRCDANPQDPEDTMDRFVETLRSREFVGLNIGFGLRGHKGENGSSGAIYEFMNI